MTKEQKVAAKQRMRNELNQIRADYEVFRDWHERNAPDGWNRPPAVLPRPGELAMGIFFDPFKNTR